jgi:hypothetical protein
MKTIALISLLLFCIVFTTTAQKPPFKLGKIELSELSVNKCPIDSGADAYIIGDYGRVTFNYSETFGFQTIFERHFRIKILKKSAFDWADITIPLYYSGTNKEEATNIKGNTFNLENGKIVVSELGKAAIFKEEVSEHNRRTKFTLPNVKEGSVIEVFYKITSDFYTIWDWNFQQTIPVLISQYQVEIPEYFNYKTFQNGYEKINTEYNSGSGNISWTEKERSEGTVTHTSFSSNRIDYQVNISKYSSENMPAFHDEPYMKSRVNYLTSMEFELKSIKWPNSLLKDYSSDWNHIATELLDNDNFGALIKQGGTKDISDKFAGIIQQESKAKAIYEYVQKNLKWNGSNRLYASKNIRSIIDDKSGNSTDINLLLINLLKKAGLKAYPVVLSTRNNGIIIMEYPVLQKLNYTIACVEIDGKRILLDATDKYCPFGFLPDKCINDKGRIIDENIKENIDLTTSQKYLLTIITTLKVNENGDLAGQWSEIRKGYCAYKTRNKLSSLKNEAEYFEDIQKENQGLTINNSVIENKDSLEKDLKITMDVTISGKAENTGDLMIINPMLFEQLEENPFKFETRKFPVDYSYGYSDTYIFKIDIPAGYNLESLPKATNLSMPDNMAKFTFNCESKNGYIQVMRKFTINQPIILPESYESLREFYTQMVSKEGESIVLKKI